MNQRRGLRLLVATLIGIALALYFEPTHCVRGWLWGEAFFDGRPTSHWRQVVEKDLHPNPRVFITGPMTPTPPTAWARITRTFGIKLKVDSSFRLLQRDEADAVLQQLADDDDGKIAGFANDVLQAVRPRQPFDRAMDDEYFAWLRLICKYNREPQDFAKLIE